MSVFPAGVWLDVTFVAPGKRVSHTALDINRLARSDPALTTSLTTLAEKQLQ